MLTNLTLRNFRAFKQQDFSFSKINIFVGPNNSGKSSAISALNLIAQSYEIPELAHSPIILNGLYDRLGTYLDVVHGNRSNTPIGFDFGFGQFQASYDFKYRQQRREIELVKFELIDKGKQFYSFSNRKDSFSVKLYGHELDLISPLLRKRRPRFIQLLPASRMWLSGADTPPNAVDADLRELAINVDRQIIRARSQLRQVFSQFDSISPFRDKPERTYLYSGEAAQKIGTTGSNMALMLAGDTAKRGAETKDMISEISRWFKVAGIADELRIKSLTPRHFEIVLSEKGRGEHNICDVGFGCSQVLPVLVASINTLRPSARYDNPILIAQEPEIHLHPNAQAALGSFFVSLLRNSGQLFLETHSDNLVLRIARHVAEGILSPDDVRIFYVSKNSGASHVTNMLISKDGRFVPDWPGGFFPQRQTESLSLAKAAFQAKASTSHETQLEFQYPEER